MTKKKSKKYSITGERLRKKLATMARDSILNLPKNTLLRVVKESPETRGRVAFRISMTEDGRPTIQLQSSFEQRVLVTIKPEQL